MKRKELRQLIEEVVRETLSDTYKKQNIRNLKVGNLGYGINMMFVL